MPSPLHAPPRLPLDWSPWQPLEGAGKNAALSTRPGLYRIRRSGRHDLDYIGQTGGRGGLRARLRMLKGVYADAMPYRDPHTAGPALWALRRLDDIRFEVSVAEVEGPAPWRKGLEALAIAQYRQQQGRSPWVSFGRMPVGFRMSSANNTRLVTRGLRFRGGPTEDRLDCHEPGVAPAGTLEGPVEGPTWGGHAWTPWTPVTRLAATLEPGVPGLYRIRASTQRGLVYVGEGDVSERVAAHLAKARKRGHRQATAFRALERLEVSWVLDGTWRKHQRLELENDLLASHLLVMGGCPAAQFLG
ncbi:hypothetical protein LZ198_36375 [Myxococcus sp. K15C18031901]|uniref:hypothetical protein n=1 Tax=Myxococcus dinghuensis TaxID=2906761 RepID=UPI0020A7B4E4|nr:hypothetical protein [Myxococcus dinghuensis]MCP3104355.1 hypothetical protein [Myxococcus dinghuensis]